MTTIGFFAGKRFSTRSSSAAQDGGGIGIRIAARVAVEPELVILSDDWIAAQRVDHRRPCRLRIHQAMDDEHDRLVRVVRL